MQALATINYAATLPVLADQLHAFNVEKGWWDEYLSDKTKRYRTAMMLVTSELSEAMEGCRKDLMDDKLPQYKMFAVELADAMIRLLDLGSGIGMREYTSTELLPIDAMTKPDQLWHIVSTMGFYSHKHGMAGAIRVGVSLIEQLCVYHQIDLRLMMEKKMEYNATREDHLRENRQKDGGKAF